MNGSFEWYPRDEDGWSDRHSHFFVEFHKWEGQPRTWTLFKRNYIHSEEEWAKTDHHPFESREGHPYNLGGGEVNECPGVIDMNTPEFLKFMVDALNDYERNRHS
jgi:hypothetical protein